MFKIISIYPHDHGTMITAHIQSTARVDLHLNRFCNSNRTIYLFITFPCANFSQFSHLIISHSQVPYTCNLYDIIHIFKHSRARARVRLRTFGKKIVHLHKKLVARSRDCSTIVDFHTRAFKNCGEYIFAGAAAAKNEFERH